MAEIKNSHVVFKERPTGEIVPGKTFVHEEIPMPKAEDLKDGEVLLEHLYITLDPAMRNWMDDERSYVEPVAIGDTMRGSSLCRCLASKSARFAKGDLVYGHGPSWIRYRICHEMLVENIKSEFPAVGDVFDCFSLHGVNGFAAFMGMNDIADPQPGETVVVSAAGGSTGSIAGQIAKLKGARVVGVAGTEEKCRWARDELGFDVVLNYKDADYAAKFKEATADLVDVYFDNVGGETLDLALLQAKRNARFVMCGMISGYNSRGDPYPLQNLFRIVSMCIKVQGYIVLHHLDQWPRVRAQLGQWWAEGKIKLRHTVLTGGLAEADKMLLEVFKGANVGRTLLEIKNIDEPPAF